MRVDVRKGRVFEMGASHLNRPLSYLSTSVLSPPPSYIHQVEA